MHKKLIVLPFPRNMRLELQSKNNNLMRICVKLVGFHTSNNINHISYITRGKYLGSYLDLELI